MREAVLSDGQKALLKRFAEVGGCVDYVLLDCDRAVEDVCSVKTHRRAAITGLEVLRDRLAGYAAEMSRQQGIPTCGRRSASTPGLFRPRTTQCCPG